VRYAHSRFAHSAGASARSMAPRTISTTGALLLALALWFAIVPAAQASFGVQGFIGGTGSLAGQLTTPQGVAVNQTGNGGVPAGTLYVAESANNRVSVFDSSGNFVRAWGEDVVSTGADQSNMIQRVTVDATGGFFTLKFGASTTSEIPATATAAEVQTALNALTSINTEGGSVSVSGGPGNAGGTTPYLVTFNGGPLAGKNQAVMTAANGATPLSGGAATVAVITVDFGGNGFEICNANPPSNDVCKTGVNSSATRGALSSPLGVAIDQATGNVYVSDQAFRRIDEYSATGSFIRSFGNNVVASGPSNVTATSAVQTLTITATGGKYKLKFGGQETAELAYNATAAEIQTALTGLTSIGAGNATVSETGAGVFKITFAGALANNPEPLITTESGPGEVLTGGTATVENTTTGSNGFEICGSSNGDICQAGTSSSVGGGFLTTFSGQLAVAPSGSPNVGDVIVADPANRRVQEFTSAGAFVRAFGFDTVAAGPDNNGTTNFEVCTASQGDACKVAAATGSGVGQFGTNSPTRVAEDSTGAIYTVESGINFRVQKFTPQVGPPSLSPAIFGTAGAPNGTATNNTPTDVSIGSAGQVFVTKAFTAGGPPTCPNGLTSGAERRVQELTANGLTLSDTHMVCGTINAANGLDATSAGGPIYVSSTTGGSRVYKLGNVTAPGATINPPSPLTATGATITGTINPNGSVGVPNPAKTSYHLEYKLTTEPSYTTYAPDVSVGAGTSPVPVSVVLGDLQPNKEYSVRFVATKEFGGGVTTATETFTTSPAPPSIISFFATNVTATSADLKATIDPLGKESSYRFEYGTSQEYGSLAPVPNETLGSGYGPVNVSVHLTGLSDTPYHFRVFAENSEAQTSVSEDSTFSFSPPTGCPNDRVRQQTGAAYLPDCRGYELVSAGQAGGAALNTLGPLTGYASNPGRFTYGALLNAIPGAGEPINDGFEGDMYVASRTPSGWTTKYVGIPGYQSLAESGPPGDEYAGNIITDRGMNRFVIWDRAQAAPIAGGPLQGTFAPDVFDNEGNLLEQLPTNLDEVPGSLTDMTEGGFQGGVAITPTLSHYVFSSIKIAFTPEGLTASPGSVYDNDVAAKTVTLVSKTEANSNIPGVAAGEYIRIPAVSDDGSHILMSTGSEGNTHLYMRVDDSVSYDISLNAADENLGVKFEGMTSDGSKVFFTTSQKMTADDEDTSVDLYMWSEGTNSLTRISAGGGAGNTDSCVPASGWTSKCNVEVVPIPNVSEPTGGQQYGKWFDSAMASETGEIYFYSPELLDGARGVPNKRDLYVYREGTVHHVATLEPSGKATRIQVTPDGAHMAFISTTKLTPYNNAGKAEMYRYDPIARTIQCVSCPPSGVPPTVNVGGSQKGLFLTLDGRTFFSTKDALVEQDANGIVDIYEFTSGRPQLISTGTGDNAGSQFQPIGLVGVSADGVDVFFSTYQTIVPEDENGEQLKFYDARSNGGFPFNVPPAPCAAADECHGSGSSAPAAPQTGTGASLGSGGNFPKAHRCPKGKRRHNGKCHRKRARHTKQGSGRHG
jgi:hypothetical protein